MRNDGRRSSVSPSFLSAFGSSMPGRRRLNSGILFFAGFALVPILALVGIRCSPCVPLAGWFPHLVPDRVVRNGSLIGLHCHGNFGLGMDPQRAVRDGGHADQFGAGARLCGPRDAASPPPRTVVDILPA